MEAPYIEKYIKQRMAELGYSEKEYHYESVRVNLDVAVEPSSPFYYNFQSGGVQAAPTVPQFTPQKFYLLADNEYYFLVEKTVDPTLVIISDTGCLTKKEAQNYSNYTFFNYKEFTGQIFFECALPGIIDLEFIRCTPYKN